MASQSDSVKRRTTSQSEGGSRSRTNSQNQSSSGARFRRDGQRNREDSESDRSGRKDRSPQKSGQQLAGSRTGHSGERSQANKSATGGNVHHKVEKRKSNESKGDPKDTKKEKGSSLPAEKKNAEKKSSAASKQHDDTAKGRIGDKDGSNTYSNSTETVTASQSDSTAKN